MKPCLICGCCPDIDIAPGILRDLRLILGPKPRTTAGGKREILCWQCQLAHAKEIGLAL